MEKNLNHLVKEAVKKHHEKAIALSDDLAHNPELAYKEFETSKKIVNILTEAGFEVEYPFSGYDTAFCGKLENGDGPNVAIMVEYDALPEIGHGCGHNLHGALSVLSGLALMNLKEYFKGTLYVIGTPAEEGEGAKIGMAASGVFDDMAAAMMIHSYSGGYSQANMDALSLRMYNFEFHGKTAHSAACPWDGKSALTASRKFLDLIDARRECFTPDIRCNSIFIDGGKATNVIPDHAEIYLEFRASSKGRLEKLDDAIIKCAKGAAMALDCEVTYKKSSGDFDDMVRVPSLESEITEIFESLGEKMSPVQPPIGSTDVGNVSYHCPTIQPLLSIAENEISFHTVEMAACTLKEEAHEKMAVGAEALALLSLKVFNDSEYREKIHNEFLKVVKEKSGK